MMNCCLPFSFKMKKKNANENDENRSFVNLQFKAILCSSSSSRFLVVVDIASFCISLKEKLLNE